MSHLYARCLSIVFLLIGAAAQAEPYLAVQQGYKCGQCHVNPTGGGERNVYGEVFSQTQLPAQRIDTGPDLWTGEVTKFLSVGGDVRVDATYQKQPSRPSSDEFDLEQARAYASVNVIPQRLVIYADELLGPGDTLNREAYAMYFSANHDWYVKAGQMYLPFGFRLQDQTALVLQATGINMTAPDRGVEFGWERGHWDAQLVVSNGTGTETETDHRKQYSSQLMYVQSGWRVGVAANYNDRSAGGVSDFGLLGGLRTGPVAWLGQVEWVDDHSVAQGKLLAGLLEANWLIAKGNNLKLTLEYLDPNRDASADSQKRYSLIYELTPIQFLQLRAGFRYSDGISAVPSQNQRLVFIQLHAFF